MTIVYDGGVSSYGWSWDISATVTKDGTAITTPVSFSGSAKIDDGTTTYTSTTFSQTKDSGTSFTTTVSIPASSLPTGSYTLYGRISVSAKTTQLPVTLKDSASKASQTSVSTSEYTMKVNVA